MTEDSRRTFTINGQRIKHYFGEPIEPAQEIKLIDLVIEDAQAVWLSNPEDKDAQVVLSEQPRFNPETDYANSFDVVQLA